MSCPICDVQVFTSSSVQRVWRSFDDQALNADLGLSPPSSNHLWRSRDHRARLRVRARCACDDHLRQQQRQTRRRMSSGGICAW